MAFAAKPGAALPCVAAASDAASLDQARLARFLALLAETANAATAASKAGLDLAALHARRAADPALAAAWDRAIAAAYDELELALLRRARFGTRKPVKRADGKQGHMTDYDDAQALRLLLAHRQAAPAAAPAASPADGARDRLADKLAALRARLEAEAGNPA